MPTTLEERLRSVRPNADGPTVEATAFARERALAALPRRPRRTRLLVAAVAAGAAAATAVLAFGIRHGPEVASAAEVRAAVSQTLASATSLRGMLVIRHPQPDRSDAPQVERWAFALSSGGDLRLTGLDTDEDLAYDGAKDVLRYSHGRWFSKITGLPPPPGDQSVDWMLELELGSVIGAFAAEPGAQVREVQYEGRPSWLLTVHADGAGGLEREITVDRALGLPVHDVLRNGDAVIGEWRLENLTVGGPLAPRAFTLEPRAGQDVRVMSEGSRRVAVDEIEAAAGYPPLVPAWLPDGYRLDHAAVSPSYTDEGATAPTGLVSLVYRRGLERVVVSTRPRDLSPVRLPNAGRFCTALSISAFICANTRQTLHSHRTTLESGALAGEPAEVTVDVAAPPTLTVETTKLLVQISGAVDEAELTRIVESLVTR